MAMTEAQLRALVAVAESGSFVGAASRLHLSQPGVSRAVKSLENELGATVFTRASGQVELTEVGKKIVSSARLMLTEIDRMHQHVSASRGLVEGRVRVGSMPSVSASIMPALLARIERHHPALDVTILDGHDDELVRWLREGIVDLAVIAGDHDGLDGVVVAQDRFVVVLPRDHELSGRESVDVQSLANRPFILTQAGCERQILAALARSDITPDIQHEVTEAATILAMVAEGLGISVMPGLATYNITDRVVTAPLDPPTPRVLRLAYHRGHTPSPGARALLELVETAQPHA